MRGFFSLRDGIQWLCECKQWLVIYWIVSQYLHVLDELAARARSKHTNIYMTTDWIIIRSLTHIYRVILTHYLYTEQKSCKMRITSAMLIPVPKTRSKSKNSKIYFYYDNFAEGLVQKGTCMYPKVECNFTINREILLHSLMKFHWKWCFGSN